LFTFSSPVITSGTGESGKSTIAKQMKIMHLAGFTKEERDTYRSILHSNIVDSMATLLRQAAIFEYTAREDLQVSETAMPIHSITLKPPLSHTANCTYNIKSNFLSFCNHFSLISSRQ
jgi:hypothetical protein